LKTYDKRYEMGYWWQWSMEFEQQAFGSYREFIQPGDLVFDIGSNRGRKTYIFLALGAAKVIAVDPLYTWGPEFVPEFYWKWGEYDKVVPVARAVTTEREITMKINKFMPYVSSMDARWMTESAHAAPGQPYYAKSALVERKAQGITLDGLINIYGIPAFIKVDVEGHEDTAVRTLSEPVKGLNMEFHQDWMPLEAIAHVDRLADYEWNYCLNNVGQFVAPEWMESGALLEFMRPRLDTEGSGSWGDLYARRVDGPD